MPEIISTTTVCDGLDVRITLDDGTPHTLHFSTSPSDLQAAVEVAAANITQPEPQPVDTGPSPIEQAFTEQRDAAKLAAIVYIKTHPDCTAQDVLEAAGNAAPLLNGAYLLGMYEQTSYERGFIESPTFEPFKQMVLAMTPEQLMNL